MQTVNLSAALSEGYVQFRQSLVSVPNLLLRQVVQMLPEDFMLLQPALAQSMENGAESSLEGMGNILGQVSGAGLGIVFVFFLAVNWAVEGDRFVRTVLLLSNQRREWLRELFLHIEERLSRYLIGLGTLSFVVGVLALVGYLIIGLPYAVLLAVFAGLMEAVPVIGPAIGAIPAIIVAFSISPEAAITVIVLSALIQAAENIWLVPKVMGSSMGVPPFVTLIAMLAFSTLFGIAGAFIAIPVAAVIQVLIEALIEYRQGQNREKLGRDQVSATRYEINELIQDIRLQAREKKINIPGESELMEDTLEEIALDLDKLLQQSGAGEQS
jgi:predicted PurR-regulated permease PerM